MLWTDEQKDELKVLFNLGHTLGEISAILKISRNTVAGQCYRLGLRVIDMSLTPNGSIVRINKDLKIYEKIQLPTKEWKPTM